jgi:superfamily II DNA or RNA helicase
VAELRDYQRETIDDFECLVAAGARSVLITAPTGSGKTVIVSATVARTVAARQLGLVLGNRRQILEHVTSAPAATPIADTVEAMLSGGAAAARTQTVNQNSTWVDHYSEPNPSQNRAVARAAACNAAGAP